MRKRRVSPELHLVMLLAGGVLVLVVFSMVMEMVR